MPFILTMALVLAGPDLDKLVSPSGYPVGSVQKGRSAAALVRLLVNPTGRVVRCDTMATVGNGSLAREVCARARHRSVHPAVGADGSAAWSQATMMASFYAAGLPEADEVAKSGPTPDAELTVSRLPGGADRADVKVVLAVDEQGAATQCAADPRAAASIPAVLVKVVCASSTALGLKPVVAPDGHPLRYVTPLTVRLIAGR